MMAEADCVLAIGTRFSDRSVGTFEAFGTWGSKMNEFHVVFEAAK